MSERNGLSSLLTDRKISAKVGLGFACVLTILAIVSGMAYSAFVSSAEEFASYTQRVAIVSVARDIDRSFLNLRRFVREYALSAVEANVDAAKQEQTNLRALLQQGLNTVRNPERRSRLEDISRAADAYIANFDKVVVSTHDLGKLMRTDLDPVGLAQTQNLEALAIAAADDAGVDTPAKEARKLFLMARLSVNKSLGRHDPAEGQAADKAFTDLDQMLRTLDTATKGTNYRKTFEEIRTGVAAYRDAFHKTSALTAEIDGMVNGVMKTSGEQAAADAESIKAGGIADQKLEEQTLLAMMDHTSGVVLTLAIGGMALGMGLAWVIGRGIARPVVGMAAAMNELASGNLDQEIPALDRGDELGQMAQAMLVFRQSANEARKLQGEAERVRVAKDRRQAAMDQHTQDFGTSASGVMATLVNAAGSMRKTAGEMTEAARRTRETAARTAQNANNSAQNLGSVAAAAEEMSASIHEISQQVSRATQAANSAVELASATDRKVGGMAEAVERVGNVVRLISDIAGQTNLLALNATIEAARAGEAGRGFAVVAGEVKALAAQTAKATEEISSQIAAIRGATGEAVTAVREVSAAIGQVNEVAAAIAAAVEEQSATTREIAASVQTVTTATQQAGKDMEEVSSVSETAQEASRSVVASADEVGGNADVLRSELTQFLEGMAKTDDADRRRYERIAGGGAETVLRPAGQAEFRAAIVDISRGGMGVRTDWRSEPGTELQVLLPGVDAAVTARVARTSNGVLALAFRQDEAMLRRVDMAMARLTGTADRKAA
jgi:methyl-accepting chemotaxis protein